MTLSAQTVITQYTGDGTNNDLNTVFTYNVDADVIVTQRVTATGAETLMVLGTNYTQSGGSAAGAAGDITPIAGSTDFTSAMTWTLERSIPLTQTLDYVANDVFPAASHESGLDRLTMHSQDDRAKSTRSLRIPPTDLSTVTTILPSSVDRASKALTFDANGNATVSTQTSTGHAKVVLDSISTLSTDTVTLTSTDWPATYDRIELEIARLGSSADGVVEIVPLVGGSPRATDLLCGRMALIADEAPSVTTATSAAADWDLLTNLTGSEESVSGSLELRHFGGFLGGNGHFTYKNTSSKFHLLDIGVFTTAVAATTWDGIQITHSGAGGVFSGTFRLWGIPKV